MKVESREVSLNAPAVRPIETARRRWVRFVQWVAAIAVAILVHGAALFLIGLPKDLDPMVQPSGAPVTFRSVDREDGGRLLREQLEFSDTAPLYFPTDWNVANAENQRVPQKSPGDIFEPYQPRLGFSRVEADRLADVPETDIAVPATALVSFRPDVTRQAGRIDRLLTIPEQRVALVEVFDVQEGDRVFETPILDVGDRSTLDSVDWKPAEWIVLIDAVGRVGRAMITLSSGSDKVDDELQIMVDDELNLDKQLIPGYYFVLVGP